MYPNSYITLFPPFPRSNKIFVAMSFSENFKSRWENVIAPAIQRIEINNIALQPHRVDMRHISDSILMEILEGITNDLLVLVDLSTIGYLDKKPIRNGNVMYELGLAQSMRLPEEVILFRSDSDDLLFDLTNVRVNTYDPDVDINGSQQLILNSVKESLNELDLKRHLAVRKVATSLDYDCWLVLLLAVNQGSIKHFPMKTMGDVLSFTSKNSAISRLLELGALETKMNVVSEIIKRPLDESADQLFYYEPTKFGREIMKYFLKKLENEKLDVI